MKSTPLIILFFLFGFCCLTNCKSPENNTHSKLRPNILFVISDDQSYPHAGAYGCTWIQTPNFDRIAKEGLLFNQAFTPNAKCAPSRAIILTGRNSWQLEEAANHAPNFPEKFKTFPETLTENGYAVGYTGKGWAPGKAVKNGQPRDLIGKKYNKHNLVAPAKSISRTDYAENFRQFLTEKEVDKPFLFWYGAHEPHRAYEFQAGINKGGKKLEDVTDIPPFWPDTDSIRADILDYAYEIEHYDNQLGKILQQLEEKEMLDNTIVIVTSDNGMPFPRIKGQIYAYDNHLPLAIRWGNGIIKPGRTIDDYVSFIDFAPTILEAAQVLPSQSGMQAITGKSLFEFFNSESEERMAQDRNFVLIGKERHDVGRPNDNGYPVRGIIQDNMAYTINFKPDRWPAGNPETGYLNTDGSPTKSVILNDRRRTGESRFWDLNFGKRPNEELYDLQKDPFCMNNLANDPSLKAKKLAMNTLLFSELTKQQDPRILGNGVIFDNYEYANEATRDYYERFQKGEKVRAGWVKDSDYESVEEMKKINAQKND